MIRCWYLIIFWLLQAQEGAKGLDKTTVELYNNQIKDTSGSGIWIQIHSSNLESPSQPANVATDEEVASLLPACIKWQSRRNVFDKDAVVCIKYTLETS